ncbi:glycoside hydrolase/phage tail family protein [Tropicimonas sp. TH_r6]|uniref:baseplate multidomain protein megatron n=1 Tax=Tropicimonas sp. TH_r6 TaxID=3082085 RepID=UPI002953287B|nr:glycoside hydrolase/phage tail family protein [Tropicimonas sp. TH_r6]MDV7145083.1 glycoside hydrolase/phage tail family protein [Tropicimonas sp. TH_r6]
MATILLSAAGAAIGGTFGGTAFGLSTAILGRAIGATLGRVIDQKLLGGGSEVVETGQIERFQLTGASEGTAVGRHYGRLRMGGQVIWSTLFKESVKTEDVGGKGGGRSTTTTKTYSYSVSLAVGLCEGEILGVGRIWADGMEVSREDVEVRVYFGSESQLPDPKIEAIEGTENAPAYRGLAYVVFEDLQLSKFGNRVPQFSFEVLRPTSPEFVPEGEENLSRTVRAVALIPGTGEYSLSASKVNYTNGFGWSDPANLNSNSGKTDLRTSLDQLATELPLCNSVSLVVSWFGSDLRCGECQIVPKVEQTEYDGDKMAWAVSDLQRKDAQEVPRKSDRPVYGGTPSDEAVVEAIKAIKEDGKSIVFYPFILMDQVDGNDLVNPWDGAEGQPSFPWRGRITTRLAPGVAGSTDGTAAAENEVDAFFGQARPEDFTCDRETVSFHGDHEWSFRRFILHYAYLCVQAGGVDAFCIGSELRGLTQIRSDGDRFPAVDELVSLARDVRAIVGPDTKISYAADWSEYFGYHPQDGSGDVFFHLDPLWGSDDVDFIGIDNYMPLSDWRDGVDHADAEWKSIYNAEYLKANVAGGEGYDWYYADEDGRDAQVRLPITDGLHGEHWIYRYKDIRNWWSCEHRERVGGVRKSTPTAWVPESKPIWFTEIGCAAIDKGTNQPNKFVDPKSSESRVPWFSSGLRDDFIQMQYIRATYQFWEDGSNNPVSSVFGGKMVDVSRAHVWAWDARPYPDFPARTDVWSDGENYRLGHWLNGRATSESLAAVVADICGHAGVTDIDVSELYGLVRGYGIDETSGARSSLQPLELAYGFDASEHDGLLRFKSRNGIPSLELAEETLVGDGEAVLSLQRSALGESAGKVRVNYIQADSSFETRTTEASLPDEENSAASSSDLAICLTDTESKRISERWLAEARIARDNATFSLPPSCAHVQVGDVVQLTYGDRKANFRVDRMDIGEALEIEAVRVEPDLFRPSTDVISAVTLPLPRVSTPVFAKLLDLPLISGDEDPVAPYVAAYSSPWPGAVAVYSSSEDEGYSLNSFVESPSVIGVTETLLKAAAAGVPDLGACLRVRIYGGALSSVTRTALLNGANALAIGDGDGGDWEIIQFGQAELVAEDTYELSYLLRGQLGTDAVMPSEWAAGSKVVVLDSDLSQINLASSSRGLERNYRIGPSDKGYADDSFVHVVHSASSAGLRPYTPVHLKADWQSDGSLRVNWVRRTRIDGDSWEGLEVPLGETSEQYLVRVVQGDNVLREAETEEPNWLYDAEMRAADAPSGAFEIRVAQLSERYGVGPFQRIEINE